MSGVRRRASRRRGRRRALILTALAALLLVLASVASAVSGVGPAAGLFDADEAIPSYREPEPGGRRALLHAGGSGAAGWDLLVYRSEPPRVMAGNVRPYCLALARGDARPIPRGGIDRPPKPGEVYGGTTECEYPPTLAARLMRRAIELRGGDLVQPRAPARTTAYYGLVLAGAERVAVGRQGEDPVTAALSRRFRLEIPRLPQRVRRQIESPRQMRATAGLPRYVTVRAFIVALDSSETPVGDRTPVVTATATFGDARTRASTLGGRRVLPQPAPPQLEPYPGGPATTLEAVAPDAARWRAIAFRTRDGSLCAGSARAPAPPYRGDLMCGDGSGIVRTLVRRAIISELGTGLPDGRRPRGSYAIFGHARAEVRRLVFSRRGSQPVVARLSPPWTTVRSRGRELRLRLFMVVVPPGAHELRPRVTLR